MIKTTIAGAMIGAMLWAFPCVAQEAFPFDSPRTVPLADPNAIPLYGSAAGGDRAEIWSILSESGPAVRNVTNPTLTPVLPKAGQSNGTAVIILPGGGFLGLAISHEGFAVAQALADRGITAFVLKYRVIPTPDHGYVAYANRWMGTILADQRKILSFQYKPAQADAEAALALVRRDAAKWSIDPHKIGMIGFSAGAVTALNVVLQPGAKEHADFIGYIYGPQQHVVVPDNAPPLFAAIAMDDELLQTGGFPVVEDWHRAKRPVELHAYEAGRHGFGLGRSGTTTTLWLDQFIIWLRTNSLLGQGAGT